MTTEGERLFPEKLRPGDEVRVIAPSRSMGIISHSVRSLAKQRLEDMGLMVSFSKHCEERDSLDSSAISSRLEDLHEAFADKNVKGVLTTIGGFNSIHLLKGIDYRLIHENPKILCGYSDITTLQNALFAKINLVTYSGPHFSTFGCLKGMDYVVEYFRKCLLLEEKEITLLPSDLWSDDEQWYLDQEKRTFFPNGGYFPLNTGTASGMVIGGNIDSFMVLQGTEFMPSLKGTILFLEDNFPLTAEVLDRQLHSLVLQKEFAYVRGIVFGRFQKASKITPNLLREIVQKEEELQGIPIIGGVDFGHTLPIFTYPIGGDVKLKVTSEDIAITLTKK